MTEAMLTTLETFYDAVPRDRARVERIGPFDLFVRTGSDGHPFYARPALGATGVTADDVAAVRARQRELGIPQAFEWVDETTPGLIGPAEAAGLAVQRAPLMVLPTGVVPEPTEPTAGVTVRLLDPDSPDFAADLAATHAVGNLAFAAHGTAVGGAGPAERDAVTAPVSAAQLAVEAELIRSGRHVRAVAVGPDGVVAIGMAQRVGAVAEIAGVGTLPSARRRGLALALTNRLVRESLSAGTGLVFLAADSDDVARIYGRIGFRRTATACIAEPADA
ncbi:MAG TPA: GNAT family N-acetyltransferase [Actinocatenispora sp.]